MTTTDRAGLAAAAKATLRAEFSPERCNSVALMHDAIDALASEPAPVAQPIVIHCPEKLKPGGCQLHNLQCGWPDCNQPPAQDDPEIEDLIGRLMSSDPDFEDCEAAAKMLRKYATPASPAAGAERERFEAWLKSLEGPVGDRPGYPSMSPSLYPDQKDAAWYGWKARAALAPPVDAPAQQPERGLLQRVLDFLDRLPADRPDALTVSSLSHDLRQAISADQMDEAALREEVQRLHSEMASRMVALMALMKRSEAMPIMNEWQWLNSTRNSSRAALAATQPKGPTA